MDPTHFQQMLGQRAAPAAAPKQEPNLMGFLDSIKDKPGIDLSHSRLQVSGHFAGDAGGGVPDIKEDPAHPGDFKMSIEWKVRGSDNQEYKYSENITVHLKNPPAKQEDKLLAVLLIAKTYRNSFKSMVENPGADLRKKVDDYKAERFFKTSKMPTMADISRPDGPRHFRMMNQGKPVGTFDTTQQSKYGFGPQTKLERIIFQVNVLMQRAHQPGADVHTAVPPPVHPQAPPIHQPPPLSHGQAPGSMPEAPRTGLPVQETHIEVEADSDDLEALARDTRPLSTTKEAQLDELDALMDDLGIPRSEGENPPREVNMDEFDQLLNELSLPSSTEDLEREVASEKRQPIDREAIQKQQAELRKQQEADLDALLGPSVQVKATAGRPNPQMSLEELDALLDSSQKSGLPQSPVDRYFGQKAIDTREAEIKAGESTFVKTHVLVRERYEQFGKEMKVKLEEIEKKQGSEGMEPIKYLLARFQANAGRLTTPTMIADSKNEADRLAQQLIDFIEARKRGG
jgi:hypothetical protein